MPAHNAVDSSRRLPTLLHISMWALILLLGIAAFVRLMPLGWSLLRGILNTGLMAVLFYANGRLFVRFFEREKWWSYFASAISLMLLLSLIRFHINMRFPYLEGVITNYQPGRVAFFFGAFITNVFTLLVGFLHESVLSRWRQDRRRLELIGAQQAAQLQFLRAQINPHFLFNTLNNIYSLAVVRSEKTASLVMRLSDLLKYVIYQGQEEYVSLKEEIRVLEEYIELFQLQHEEPCNIRFESTIHNQELSVEPLLLVPIVENCFKHCDFAENEDAFVKLQLEAKGERLWFYAENSFNPRARQKDTTGGVGVENIRRRLNLRYPDQHMVTFERTSDRFIVSLRVDLSKK